MLPDEVAELPIVVRTPILDELDGGTVLVDDVWTPGRPRLGEPAPGAPEAIVLDGTPMHLPQQR